MVQEKKNHLERSKLMEQRFSEAFDYAFPLIFLVVFLLLKWDRPFFLWLGKILSYVPILKLLPQSTYADMPLVLDCFLFAGILYCVSNLLVCLLSTIGDCIKTSFFVKIFRYWDWFSSFSMLCALVIFLRLLIDPNMFDILWLQKFSLYSRNAFMIDAWNPAFLDFIDSILLLLQAGLQIAVCISGAIFLLALIVVSVRSVLELIRNPKPKASKEVKAAKAAKPKRGTSGLRKTAAETADARLSEFLQIQRSAQGSPKQKETYLRVQIMNPRETNRNRMLRWNDRHQIYLHLDDYRLTFLREDSRAYLLGGEKMELLPNKPEVIRVGDRNNSSKVIITYIV